MAAADTRRLIAPGVVPTLDPEFRPAALSWRAFQEYARATGRGARARFALEQQDGAVHCFATDLPPEGDPAAAVSFHVLERLVKLALWTCGGYRIHLDAPGSFAERLRAHYRDTPTGRFDSEVVGERVHAHALEVVATKDVPAERSSNAGSLGGHMEGCRIGFDLGGSDRKVAAVIDGKVVFSEETEWDPYHQPDPRYHWDGIMDSLRKAARHLPRVDAIGGSAAGVYVRNEIKFSSLFRGIPRDLFDRQVKRIFLDLQKEWGVPFEVVNDGEVTALLGAMSIGDNSVLGLALGTSTASGFIDARGRVTSRLNEVAFAPIDYRTDAPRDEWSGDGGCCAQYLSQQAVGRLVAPAGIALPEGMSLPQRLKEVQALMTADDPRARAIYRTIGVYLGYAVAHLASVYDFRHVLLVGRVISGAGGDIILDAAREVLGVDFPALAGRVGFHLPSEKDKRHGQAIAAASLPGI